MPALAAFLLLLLASVLPEVEDPIPDTVGLELPFALAGVGGVLGGLLRVASSTARRERAMKKGGVIGFALGASLYLLALVVQLSSGL